MKAYTKTNLANGFIILSKLPTVTSIFFDRKSNEFFRLYINYKSLNNLSFTAKLPKHIGVNNYSINFSPKLPSSPLAL